MATKSRETEEPSYHDESDADADAAQNLGLVADGVDTAVQTTGQVGVGAVGVALALHLCPLLANKKKRKIAKKT